MRQHTEYEDVPHLGEAYIHKCLRDMQALRMLEPPRLNGSAP